MLSWIATVQVQTQRYDGILSYENEVLQSVFMNKESELEKQPLYDSAETHESLPEPTINEPKVVSQPKVWSDAPIIEEYESDSEDEHISDKKNKVLFTDSECLVLSLEFKLPDENQVLLRIPRQNNMYSFNLRHIVSFRRFSWVFFLRTKDETSGILKDFIRQIENQLNQKVKTIRCDNGTKFKNMDFIEFCGSKGIKREYSNARTPQQNGVAERKNRTLIEAARTMLADSFLPNTFWAEAVSTACYVLNRVLVTKPHNKTPYELVTGTEDNIDAGGSDIEAESAQDYFVLPIWSSYTSTVKSSKAMNAGEEPNKHPDLKTDEKPVDKEDQVFLDELERLKRAAKASSTNTVNTASTPVSTTNPYGGLSFTDLTNTDQDDSEIPALEEIYDNPTAGIFTNASYDDEGAVADFTNLETIVNASPIPTSRINSIHPSTLILGDPKSAVQTRSKVTKSSRAHAFEQHCCNSRILKVWLLVDLPYGKKVIRTKWVYRNKKDERGFIDPKYPKKVYKVVKALYGLHQAPRAWYATLSTFLLRIGYQDPWVDEFEALNEEVDLDVSMGRAHILHGLQVKQKDDDVDFVSVKMLGAPIETQKPLVKVMDASDVDVTTKTSSSKLLVSSFDLEAYSDSDYAGAKSAGNPNVRWSISWQETYFGK
ncbi:putative ribonuclease H-like domain-containing protein [Tanacetum coccineum]